MLQGSYRFVIDRVIEGYMWKFGRKSEEDAFSFIEVYIPVLTPAKQIL